MAAALTVSDIFMQAMPLSKEKAAEAERVVEETVERHLEKTVQKHVERAFATEIKHLATREDLKDVKVNLKDLELKLKVEMHAMEERLGSKIQVGLFWMIGILVAVLAGFVATLFTFVNKVA